MTEVEWLACTDPTPMLEFLRGKTSDRKLRLFACACCRRLWSYLTDERSRNAVDVAERHADGAATVGDRKHAAHDAHTAWDASLDATTPPVDSPEAQAAMRSAIEAGRFWVWDTHVAAGVVSDVLHELAYVAAVDVANACAKFVDQTASKQIGSVERAGQASLLQCIVSNSFHRVTVDSAWLTANVVALAQTIYNDRAFDRMPELADALHGAGCDNDEILSHCRGPGPHVRGCWVVDMVTGKG